MNKIDLTEFTYKELSKLHWQIEWEMVKRHWWLLILVALCYVGFLLYTNKGTTKRKYK